MKKIISSSFFVAFFILNSNAQAFKIGVGPSLSLPIGNLADINSLGVGAEITGILGFSENFEAFAQTGYHRFFGKKINLGYLSYNTDAISNIPFLFGARYKTNGIMIGASMGYALYGENSSGFCFSPQIGYSIENIDIIGQFNSTSVGGSNLSYLGVKTFYKF